MIAINYFTIDIVVKKYREKFIDRAIFKTILNKIGFAMIYALKSVFAY